MRLAGRAVQAFSDLRVMTIVALSLSVALPLVMYQSSTWRKEAASNAARLDHLTALRTISGQAAEHIKNWSEAKKRMPLTGAVAPAPGFDPNRTTQMGVNIDNQRLSRVEADRVLDGLAQNADGLFVPDALLIRGANPGDGIFAKNTADDAPGSLALTIKGEFVSRDFQ